MAIQSGMRLTYMRDMENAYDPYAIRVLFGAREVGFIPREFSKLISTEIDINQIEYMIKVIRIKKAREYQFNNITVEISPVK